MNTTAGMSTLTELTRLDWTRPRPGASTAVVAAWYVAKAELHQRIATGTRDQAEQAREIAYAAAALRHARALREGVAA